MVARILLIATDCGSGAATMRDREAALVRHLRKRPLDEVLRILRDEEEVARITDRPRHDVVCDPQYRYDAFENGAAACAD